MKMTEIESLTEQYQAARSQLEQAVTKLEQHQRRVSETHLPKIRELVAVAMGVKHALHNAIEASPDQFVQPRTVTLHGIRVGIVKGRDQIKWDDDQRVVELIQQNFPAEADALVKITRKPVKSALNGLSMDDLKHIGCSVVHGEDEVLIKPVDDGVDKIVATLLKDGENLEVDA